MSADNTTRPLSRSWTQLATACAAAIALCLVIVVWLLRLPIADVTVPFVYDRDALIQSVVVKGLVENGWVWHNPLLGAPFGSQFLDFPFYDNLDLALMKLIAMFTSNYAVVFNLFFLLTFPLTVTSSMLALRSFNVSYLSAIFVSLLYAFIPFHFYRGEGHLFIGAYFLLPLMSMLILWLWTGQLTRRRIVSAIVVCALTGSAFGYYAVFGCYFLLVIAIVSAIR